MSRRSLLLLATAVVLVATPIYSHVALTFPPARKYDLDFLDNSRTKAPCGMPKGSIKTSLLAGTKLNVTWHLAYPHRGGFKIQLLDYLERPVLDLTPTIAGSEFVSNDATAQSFEVQLPPEYVCADCTLRLLRQASEWGSSYRFWSCADVSIKTRKEYRESCSSHGRYLLGRCKCDRLYYGRHCQYRDECWEDSDCGDHGKCVDVGATTPPASQCYCQMGWFGPGCNKRSPIKSMEIDFGLYTEKKLSDTFRLYWRILKEHKEIEVAMVVNGTSYVALGWRPNNLTSSCKNFPLIGNPSESSLSSTSGSAEPTTKPEPKSEPQPSSEPEPNATPEPKSEPEPEPETKAEPSAEPTTTKKTVYARRAAYPISISTPQYREEAIETSVSYKVTTKQGRRRRETNTEPVAEPTSEPEPTQNGATPKPEPKSEPTSIPKPVSDPKSEPEPVSEPTSKAEPSPEPTSEPTSKAEPTSEPISKPTSKLEPNSKSEPSPEPISEPVSEPTSKAEPISEPTSKPEPNSKAEPSPEPISEPVSEPTSKPEPVSEPTSKFQVTSQPRFKSDPTSEPEPSSEPEPKSEPEPTSKPEPSSEPEPNSKPEPNSEPEPISKSHSNLEALQNDQPQAEENNLHPYTPRHDFNPMDCTDIIIGSARGTASRIADYYTRDRSTPRMDSFWGGKNDLTAALGFEKDGVTTILFRKKLQALEMTDHSIENGPMHVIWSQGQQPGKYVHIPESGLEKENAKVKNFYKEDELKYHGHGAQRGKTTLNFFEEDKKSPSGGDSNIAGMDRNLECAGIWKTPRTCLPENGTCEYSVKWLYLPRKDEIQFTITTKHTDTWTGIGFSNNEKMAQTDAILGWVDKKTGRHFLMDTWIQDYTQPLLDLSQDIYNTSGRIDNGITMLSFTRKRITQDQKDLSFTNTQCFFMMYLVHGGTFNSVNKKIRKHNSVPIISPERVCIRACNDLDYEEMMTTPEPPSLDYIVEVKITNLGENYKIPKQNSAEFKELANLVKNSLKDVFNKAPGYKDVHIENIIPDNSDVIAHMTLQYDKATAEKGRSLNKNDHFDQIHKLLAEKVNTGIVGALKVDPEYLVFEPQSLTSNIISDESNENNDNGFFSLSQVKLYVVLGCIAALVLVAIVQASCTIYRTSHRQAPSHKDHLIPNSAWKDYSAANTNYAFEAFEPEEKLKNGHNGRTETLPNKTPKNVVRPTSRPPSIPPPGYAAPRVGGYMGDTRSLQRPRGPYAQAVVQERSTLSLPRTSYERHRAPSDMQPDFYFMPSQRKYSGEVVRVYVDYNNAQK